MTDEPTEDDTPTLEVRVAGLEATVAELRTSLDTALTANEILQTRYGQIMDVQGAVDGLTTRVNALEA